jgi:hypothetical protein
MRPLRRERKRNSIYPRYSWVATAATRSTPYASPMGPARIFGSMTA